MRGFQHSGLWCSFARTVSPPTFSHWTFSLVAKYVLRSGIREGWEIEVTRLDTGYEGSTTSHHRLILYTNKKSLKQKCLNSSILKMAALFFQQISSFNGPASGPCKWPGLQLQVATKKGLLLLPIQRWQTVDITRLPYPSLPPVANGIYPMKYSALKLLAPVFSHAIWSNMAASRSRFIQTCLSFSRQHSKLLGVVSRNLSLCKAGIEIRSMR